MGWPARSLNGLRNCRGTRLVLRRCPSRLQGPMRREALDALARLYRTKNETGKLYDILQRLHESSPDEPPITADLARLGLNIGQNTKESQELAKEAYDRTPNEVNCAVTYAFCLYRLGRSTEGLEVIKKLPADQLHD